MAHFRVISFLMVIFLAQIIICKRDYMENRRNFNPQQLMRSYIGYYESTAEAGDSFGQFLLELNQNSTKSSGGAFALQVYKKHEELYCRIFLLNNKTKEIAQSREYSIDPGSSHSATIKGCRFEYFFTWHDDILKGIVTESANGGSYDVFCMSNGQGLTITLKSEGYMVKQIYRQALPPSVLGYYENVPERQSSNFHLFAQTLPLPNGVQWMDDTRLYIGRDGNNYLCRYVIHPTHDILVIPFRLNEILNKTVGETPLQYQYTVLPPSDDSNLNSTTLHVVFTTPTGQTFEMTAAIDENGMSSIYRSDSMIAERYYRKHI